MSSRALGSVPEERQSVTSSTVATSKKDCVFHCPQDRAETDGPDAMATKRTVMVMADGLDLKTLSSLWF